MARFYDIAIVGAGIGGLATAIALGRAGHRIVLYERFPQSRPIGSGLMLQPTGLAALERLGLRAEIEALGARIDRLHGLNQRGALVFDLGYSELDPALYAIGVHRAALHHALWSAFASGGVAIETGWTIVDVATGADGRARLVDESARTSPAFDLVIDASGARSTLRRLASPAKARAFAYGAVWASVPDLAIAPAMLAQRYVAARIMIGHLPVGRTRADGDALAAFFWSLKPADHAGWRARFDDWREEVVRLWPALTRLVEGFKGPDDFTFASYIHFTARRPFRGPLALIGDSAHATSPQLGQGANSALLDALALADSLETCADIEQALHAYAWLRRRHVRFYQFASAAMTPFFQSDSALLAGARDIAFHRLKIAPWLRDEMLRTLAGLKTGLLTSASAEELAGTGRATKRNLADDAPSDPAHTHNS